MFVVIIDKERYVYFAERKDYTQDKALSDLIIVYPIKNIYFKMWFDHF